MADPFAKIREQTGRDTADSLEIARIVGLPTVLSLTAEEVDAVSRAELTAEVYERGERLFPTQAGAVLAWDMYGGLFAPIGVGWGKTLITLMIANRAYERQESRRSVLFVPPGVYEQLRLTDIPSARKWVGLSVPFHFLGGRSAADRRRMAASDRAGCYVLPYSLLSTKDAEALLGGDMANPPPNAAGIPGIRPDLLILDEAHNVKNPAAARTARLKRYMAVHQPRVCALSGTITAKSIMDYYHLIGPALGDRSPLPMHDGLAQNWSFVLDPEKMSGPGQSVPTSQGTGPIRPLVTWAARAFPGESIPEGVPGFRKAYRLRLTSCPGVVATGDAEIGVSLSIHNEPVPKYMDCPGWGEIHEFMRLVDEEELTPSGDVIEHGFHKWKHLNELSSGFYYRLRWPSVEEVMRSGCSAEEAVVYLDLAVQHHAARQAYGSELSRWIKYQGRQSMDTPLLVAANMAHYGARDVGEKLYGLWREAKDLEFEGMPERISEPVRVCSYKVDHAVRWAQRTLKATKGKHGALVWFHHDDLGRWAAEAMKAAGLPTLWCPADSVRPGSNAKIGEAGKGLGPHTGHIVVASMGGHGTGKNLQHFQHQLFLQFPRQAALLEQVLGRTHRNGQQAEELCPTTMNTTAFDHQNQWACLIDSLYIHQTTGSRQKAILASYDPLPQRFPDDFLRERGFVDLPKLDAETKARLVEKFGKGLAG